MKKQENIDKNKRIECEIVFTNILYPRDSLLKAGTWVSARGRIIKVIEGLEALQNIGLVPPKGTGRGTNVSIRGDICSFDTLYDLGKPFKIIADLVEDAKYGVQLNIFFINSLEKIDDKDSQYKFLSTILSNSQIDLLYNSLENPFKEIEEGTIESLMKIKGIGFKKALDIIEKFKRSQDNSKAYIELFDFGLTKKRIDKLVMDFGSPDTLVEVIKENPYRLIELVKGFGWKSADALALNSGISPTSEKRIEAFIFYFLENMGYGKLENKYSDLSGSTWIEFMEFYNIMIEEFPELHPDKEPTLLTDCIKRMLKKVNEDNEKEKPRLKMVKVPTGSFNENGKEITFKKLALYKFWELENNIASELIRIQNGALLKYDNPELAIKNTEFIQGFEFTEEQREGIYTVLNNQVSVVTGKAGCVDADTEFFNGEKWKKISEYSKGDKVLQYNENGTAELVEPLAYIKQPSEWLWHFKTKYGLNQCLSEDHTVVYITSKGNLYQKPMKEIVKQHLNAVNGFQGKFITSFRYDGKGLNLTDAEIKLMLAVICDGSFNNKNRLYNPKWQDKTTWCRINIKKEAKKSELEKILQECGIKYKKTKWNNKDRDYDNYSFYAPIRTKKFTKEWYNSSQHQLQIIADNILQWDGCTKNGRMNFSTTVKENADFIQWVFSACGYRASILTYDRRGTQKINYKNGKTYTRKSIEYSVTITLRTRISMGGTRKDQKTPITKHKTTDGYEYCFTVPSHMLVLRRGNRIFITGNCGKTSVVKGMLSSLPNYSVELTSFTGVAASRLAEVTQSEGKTTHRLLQFVPNLGFQKNENNPINANIVIIDELGMYSLDLFYSLLKAIPQGTKLVMVGDPNQLPNIGLGNLFKNIIESKVIPVATLTQIHRQSAESGIITEALKVSNGKQLVKHGTYIEETRGNLQDFKLITYQESCDSQDYILNEFKRLHFEEKVPVEDIQIIVPLRKKGQLSINNLNPIIQEMVNPDTLESSHKKITIVESRTKKGDIEYQYDLKEKDKIRINNNTYRGIIDVEGNKIEIFNGNIGTLEKIDLLSEEAIADLGYMGKVIVPSTLWNVVSLSYASSCHASQGSEFPYVIVGLDCSAYTLLNRNWLYTAITRAKKYCVLCAQEKALRSAISQTATDNKRTFLKDALKEQKRLQKLEQKEWEENF